MEERCAGVDWASEEHAVRVHDADGSEPLSRTFAHDEAGIRALARTLLEHRVGRVAIERPDGILVERLLEAGLRVLHVHPNQLAAARDRFPVAHGKSDGFDAFVLCELARTDAHRFRAIEPDADETRALRALSRTREDLVAARVELANQLRAQLEAFWPGALIFADVDSPISLAFLERYPSPQDARGLGEKRLAAFLHRNSYCGRRSPAELLGRLRRAPAGRVGKLETEARRAAVPGLVAALRPIVEQISRLTSQLKGALSEHPDAAILRPLFRDRKTVVCPAALIAEIGDCRARYPSPDALAADGGQCPVAVESGKRKVATLRRACDKRLRTALCTLADSTRHWHPWARKLYRDAIARGHDHPHAIRILGRAWCRVLWRCWQDQVPYDPARHGALARLEASRTRPPGTTDTPRRPLARPQIVPERLGW